MYSLSKTTLIGYYKIKYNIVIVFIFNPFSFIQQTKLVDTRHSKGVFRNIFNLAIFNHNILSKNDFSFQNSILCLLYKSLKIVAYLLLYLMCTKQSKTPFIVRSLTTISYFILLNFCIFQKRLIFCN